MTHPLVEKLAFPTDKQIKGKRIALLYSGGLDSYALFNIAQRDLRFAGNIDPVHIPLATDTNLIERLNMREQLGHDTSLMRMRYLPPLPIVAEVEQPDGFVPLRNLMFAAEAVMKDYDIVWLGAVRGEASRDKSRKFFKDAGDIFSYMLNKPITIAAPSYRLTKAELVQTYLLLGGDEDDLYWTTSCYHDDWPGCGRCMACVRRWVALSLNDIHEWGHPAQTPSHPYWAAKRLVTENKRAKFGLFLRQPIERWPDILVNNADLFRAIRKHEHEYSIK